MNCGTASALQRNSSASAFAASSGKRANDQRRAGFIDQNIVGFIDQREIRFALHRLFSFRSFADAKHLRDHVGLSFADAAQQQAIAQEIEAKLVGGAVGNIAFVRFAALVLRHLRLNDAHAHAQQFIDRPHPLGVALGQVIIDRGQVHPFAGECGQIQRQRRHQRFTFARLHFHDAAMMQGGAAQNLHVEVPHVQRPAARFAHQGIRLGQ